MSEENQIKFWELDTNINNLNNNFSNNENLISKINQETNIEKQNTINLENIKIQEIEKQNKPKLNFENINTNNTEKKHYHINYRKTFIISFIVILISVFVSISLHFYNNYMTSYSTQVQIEENKTLRNINKIKNFLNIYLWFDFQHWAWNNYNIVWENGINNLNEIINWNTSYIQKKDILNNSMKDLINDILSNHKKLENIKKSITKEGFFSNDISNIISEEEQISSIQNSLLSLEAIKFNSAINVFPYLDTFLEWLSNVTNISKENIEDKNKNIISRWDKDINLYLKNCYLNPFEINYECNIIWDFDKYYILTDDIHFDTKFFKQLIRYTDTKLEQTELPSFRIEFKRFDKNSNQITFNIDINTFKQDEIELTKKWILSPHVFILNNLINNLRQSKFILWKWIIVRSLKVEPKTVSIWETEFMINNSNKTFTVDIQKESEREIDDFVNIND